MALVGNELVLITGLTAIGAPSGAQEQCTTQDIANLSGGGGGGNPRVVATITSNTTAGSAANTDYVYYANGTLTLTLPSASGNKNRYSVNNIGVGTVTVAGTINGQTNYMMAQQYQGADFMSNQFSWNIF